MESNTERTRVVPLGERGAASVPIIACIIVALVALLLGVVGGIFAAPYIPKGRSTATLAGVTSVDESGLDAAMGTYTVKGDRRTVTVRDAILETSTLDAAKNADGTYDVPSVDTVLSIARNDVLQADAEQRGLTATEEDAKQYAQKTLGTQDFAEIAAGYSMSQEQVVQLMTRSALLDKLRDQVVTTAAVGEPAPPAPAEAGKENEPQQQYATYIIGLVGDEWDANANSWARADGPYRQQLKDYTISNESATYAAAQAAYYVAYSQYSKVQQQVSTEWTDYVNTLLADVPVELVSAVA